jgi:hypothetical protein
MNMPQPPHGQGYPIQQPSGQSPQGPPQGPPAGAQPGAPPTAAPTQQFQSGPGGEWQPAGPPPKEPKPPKPPKSPMAKVISAIWVLGLVSIAGTVIGLSVKENGENAWHSVHAWGGLAIAGAVLTLAPALAGSLNLTPHRAWEVATCGAGALLLFWVLFVLPAAGTNTSLVVTVGAAAGIVAAWIAPGREADAAQRPDQHSW